MKIFLDNKPFELPAGSTCAALRTLPHDFTHIRPELMQFGREFEAGEEPVDQAARDSDPLKPGRYYSMPPTVG